ncbi:ComEA family DNA-binding protein [Kutzneria sp. 744]|uniref:ComEA family DNA-binding protein n=1 Tax=Kutzneria sp. (strain 744) TaxID=345341 RepID=UPI0003EEDBEA|nr:ComEA family DNA-binding protein [Kutzneria sp. 744]EWM13016.1 competence protein ComEA [Kutzneria sp. 744]
MLDRLRPGATDHSAQVRKRLAEVFGDAVPEPQDTPDSDTAEGRAGPLVERWLPGGARVRRPRTAVLALAAAVLVAAVAAALGMWLSRPVLEQPPALPVPATPTAAHSAGTGRPGPLVVSVVGKVARPGLVTVPDGSRVADALRAAGGPLPDADLTQLNLARKLSDGEQIAVGVPQPEAAPGQPPGKINLNTATQTDLETLPGVGPTMAQRILQWRTKNGRFQSVDQLREVDGIGATRFDHLKELVQT